MYSNDEYLNRKYLNGMYSNRKYLSLGKPGCSGKLLASRSKVCMFKSCHESVQFLYYSTQVARLLVKFPRSKHQGVFNISWKLFHNDCPNAIVCFYD